MIDSKLPRSRVYDCKGRGANRPIILPRYPKRPVPHSLNFRHAKVIDLVLHSLIKQQLMSVGGNHPPLLSTWLVRPAPESGPPTCSFRPGKVSWLATICSIISIIRSCCQDTSCRVKFRFGQSAIPY